MCGGEHQCKASERRPCFCTASRETGWNFQKYLFFSCKSEKTTELPVLGQKPRNGLLILSTFQHRFPVDTAYLHPQLLLLSRGQQQWKLHRRGMLGQIHRDSLKNLRLPMMSCREFVHSNYFLLGWTGEFLGAYSSEDD